MKALPSLIAYFVHAFSGGHLHAFSERLEHISGSGVAPLSFHLQRGLPRDGEEELRNRAAENPCTMTILFLSSCIHYLSTTHTHTHVGAAVAPPGVAVQRADEKKAADVQLRAGVGVLLLPVPHQRLLRE